MNGDRLPPDGALWQWVRFISQILIIPVLIWGVKLTVDVEVMKGNRFTSSDAIVQTQVLLDVISSHAAIAGHPVIIERVGNLEEDILRRLEAIELQLTRITAR